MLFFKQMNTFDYDIYIVFFFFFHFGPILGGKNGILQQHASEGHKP